MKFRYLLVIATSAAFLAACGGGGGGDGSPPIGLTTSAASFPLQSAYRSFVANGFAKSFTVSGTCSGTGNATISAANTPAVFEGITGFSSTSTLTGTFTNCTPTSLAQSVTSYYDNNYTPLGDNVTGGRYSVYAAPLSIPVNVKVGDTGVLGTENLFTNSTKLTPDGTQVLSYVVEADTATTAIFNLIAKNYNATGTLTATEQDRYRIGATGALVPVSFDIQYTNGSTTHLVFTF